MFRWGLSSSPPLTLHLSPHTKGHELPPHIRGDWTLQDRKQKMVWVLPWQLSPGRHVTRSSETVASVLWRKKDQHTSTLSPPLSPVCLSLCLLVHLQNYCADLNPWAVVPWRHYSSWTSAWVWSFFWMATGSRGLRTRLMLRSCIGLNSYSLTSFPCYYQISWVWN